MLRYATLLTCLLTTTVTFAGHPWPMVGGDRMHQGRYPGIFASQVSERFAVKNIGKYGFGGVAVGDLNGKDVVYGSASDSTEGQLIWAIDSSGAIVWRIKHNDSVDCTPLLTEAGQVVFADQGDFMVALEADTGKQAWSVDLSKHYLGTGGTFVSSPTDAGDGTIYVMTDPSLGGGSGDLIAVKPAGQVAWVYHLDSFSTGDGAVAVLDDDSLIGITTGNLSGGMAGRVFKYDPGKSSSPLVWDFNLDKPFPFYGSAVVDDDGSIYFGAKSQAAGSKFTMALTAAGKTKWTNLDVSSRGTPAIGPTLIYFISTDNDLVALDKADGKVQWRVAVGKGSDANRAPPVVDRCGTAVAASTAGNIVAVSRSGQKLWEKKFDGQGLGSPAVGSDGTIYVRGYGLYAFAGTAPASCPDGNPPPDAAMPQLDAGVEMGADGPVSDMGQATKDVGLEPRPADEIGVNPVDYGIGAKPKDDGGCGCHVDPSSDGTLWVLSLLALALCFRRRR